MPSEQVPSSAQGVILLNARISTVVVLLQLFYPRRLYDSPITRWISDWTGLPMVHLEPSNSPAHSVILVLNFVILIHLWMSARTTRTHAHASTALMEFVYSIGVLLSCTPLFPHEFGSSISIVAAVPNLIFATAICWKGNIGWKDFVGLFGGNEGIRVVDTNRKNGPSD